MRPIINHDEILSLINTDFDYLAKKGLQIVKVDIDSTNSFWAVDVEGKCHIRINWYWRDGLCIMISKSGTADNEYWKCYAVDTLACFLINEEIVRQFYDNLSADNSPYQTRVYSNFLSTHLDKIVELVISEEFEKQDFKLKQIRKSLDALQIKRGQQKS